MSKAPGFRLLDDQHLCPILCARLAWQLRSTAVLPAGAEAVSNCEPSHRASWEGFAVVSSVYISLADQGKSCSQTSFKSKGNFDTSTGA